MHSSQRGSLLHSNTARAQNLRKTQIIKKEVPDECGRENSNLQITGKNENS